MQFEFALNQEEDYWRQKASAVWCAQGERNTALFHIMSKRKKARLGINQVTYQESLLTDKKEIIDSAISHFSSLFASSLCPLVDPVFSLPPSLVTPEQNSSLTTLPTLAELKKVVFSLKTDSAPGPDGFTGKFFQICWEIIKEDLLECLLDFFSGSSIPLGFSHTFLALIPKTTSPQTWNDYRPISLCSNLQKILSKLLNDRLAGFLPELITANQSGFVKNRAIIDNILLTQEMTYALDNKVSGSYILVKLDMMKAYDRVHWSFLSTVLTSFGFDSFWIQLVMSIVSSCHYSLLINGESCGFIKSNKGLRQGDPLSPALFVLMSEFLTRSLNSLFSNNPALYYKVPKGLPVSHLAYADDCIIFCNRSQASLRKLKNFLLEYEAQSGQKINLGKSGFIAGKRASPPLISSILEMPVLEFPFIYLGAPISKGRRKKILFLPLLDKIKAKFSGWNLDLLSQGGKLTLIKSV